MPPNTSGFDDLYVLSIPTFTWIKLYPTDRNGTGDFPHHSMSCNVVSGAQMLIIGGTFPLSQDCDSPEQWGTHNNDMGKQNDRHSYWELFMPNKSSYAVPEEIVRVVGGGPAGAATLTTPAAGFGHNDLRVLMTRRATIPARTPTRQVSPSATPQSGLSIGAIAGIAVAGGVLLLGLLAGCFCFYRRGRMSKGEEKPNMANNGFGPNSGSGQMLAHPGWSPNSSNNWPPSPYHHHSPRFDQQQTVTAYSGPPAELSAGTDQLSPLTSHGYVQEMPLPPHEQPKYDSYGNLWVPQVSAVQVSPVYPQHNGQPHPDDQRSAPGSPQHDNLHPVPAVPAHHYRSHHPSIGSLGGGVSNPDESTGGAGTPPQARTPQSPRELRSYRGGETNGEDRIPTRHQTYYHP
jgi:hypothetical protein